MHLWLKKRRRKSLLWFAKCKEKDEAVIQRLVCQFSKQRKAFNSQMRTNYGKWVFIILLIISFKLLVTSIPTIISYIYN